MADTAETTTGGTDKTDQTPETPHYKSPLEEALESMPLGIGTIFKSLFSAPAKSGDGGSGRFEFSIEEMVTLRHQFEKEADELREMRDKAASLAHDTQPMAKDPASLEHYKQARQHFGNLQEAVDQQFTFASKFAEAIDKVIKQKAAEDSAAAAKIERLEKSLG